MINNFIFVLLIFSPMLALANSTSILSIENQTELNITVYNNFALIKDTRNSRLSAGENHLHFEEISPSINPETAILSSSNKSNPITIIEQSYNANLLTPKILLDSHLGNDIKIIRINPVTGQETKIRATILSTKGGVILQVGNHIETGMPRRIHFSDIPDNLNNIPSLNIKLKQRDSSNQRLTLRYLTEGLSWKADYVAEINNDETQLNLSAWITLSNHSGLSYKNANIQFVAGELNNVNNHVRRFKQSSVSAIGSETLVDYQLYSIIQKTDLPNNQSKQVALFSRTGIPVTKHYSFNSVATLDARRNDSSNKKIRPDIQFTFKNNAASNLAISIPKGIVRGYTNDQNKNLQYLGAAKISHKSKNEMVDLRLGKANDIYMVKKQVAFEVISKRNGFPEITESAYEIVIHNAKDIPVEVTLDETISGSWNILSESHLHKKITANTAQWKISVNANDQTKVKYKIKRNGATIH